MTHQHIARAMADANADDLRTTARSRPTAAIGTRRRRRALVAALVAGCGAASTADALARPADDAGRVPAPKVGDTPADFPGAHRAPEYDAASTAAVLRPEALSGGDAGLELPIVLAGAALVLGLGGTGFVATRSRGPAGRAS